MKFHRFTIFACFIVYFCPPSVCLHYLYSTYVWPYFAAADLYFDRFYP